MLQFVCHIEATNLCRVSSVTGQKLLSCDARGVCVALAPVKLVARRLKLRAALGTTVFQLLLATGFSWRPCDLAQQHVLLCKMVVLPLCIIRQGDGGGGTRLTLDYSTGKGSVSTLPPPRLLYLPLPLPFPFPFPF